MSRQPRFERREPGAPIGANAAAQMAAIGPARQRELLEVCDRVGVGDDGLARIFATLGHPLRLRLLSRFDDRSMSPTELAERSGAGVSLGVVAYHVRILRDAGLLELDELVPVRGSAEHFYRLTDCGHAVRELLHHARSRQPPSRPLIPSV